MTLRQSMFRGAVSLSLLAAFLSRSFATTIDTVPIGDPGNAPDAKNFGSVAYNYRIGTYEVTNSQYTDFLNAKAASDPLNLYNPLMGSSAFGGIVQSGVSGSFTYAVKPIFANKPVNDVNWFDAVRFVNWLGNGQGNGDTETGSYTLLGGTPTPSNGVSVARNPGATWVLPNENEWYKAAYYQPKSQGGDVDNYWLYPTRSNIPPTAATASPTGDINNPGANVANFSVASAWNGTNGLLPPTGNVTTVGSAGPLSASYYGTFDQGGNVEEWTEQNSLGNGQVRIVRGGSFAENGPNNLQATVSVALSPSGPVSDNDANLGFRIAIVPEPSSAVLMTVGIVGVLISACLKVRHAAGRIGNHTIDDAPISDNAKGTNAANDSATTPRCSLHRA
jgi:formylglycine-generating enzyme